MKVLGKFSIWTTGNIKITHSINLNRTKSYMIAGGLTLNQGADYTHAYISETEVTSGDQILVGVRDLDGDNIRLNVNEILAPSTTRVTIALNSKGGKKRFEGVLFEL